MGTVVIDVMLKSEILDPQGQAVAGALPRLGFGQFSGVRQGKRFELHVDGPVTAEVLEAARKAADTLLSNPVIEDVVSVRDADADPGADAGATAAAAAAAAAPGLLDHPVDWDDMPETWGVGSNFPQDLTAAGGPPRAIRDFDAASVAHVADADTTYVVEDDE